jgi:hypothetical protein
MPATRVVQHVRVLTVEQIRELSPHGFRDYRNKALRMRERLHGKFQPFVHDPPEPTEKDVHDIRTLDWLCHEVNRERDRRADADWKRRRQLYSHDRHDRKKLFDKSGQFDKVT